MTKKELYCSPQTDILELRYTEPLCVTASGGEIPDYDPIDPPGFNAPAFPEIPGLF